MEGLDQQVDDFQLFMLSRAARVGDNTATSAEEFFKKKFSLKGMKRVNPQNLMKKYLGIFICSGIPAISFK